MHICPYLSGINLDGELVKVRCLTHECAKYVQVQGRDSNTGVQVNEWKCSDAWIPMLLIEGSAVGRQTAASVQSFRNETVRAVQGIAAQKRDEKVICQD